VKIKLEVRDVGGRLRAQKRFWAIQMVAVEGQETLPASIGKVSINDKSDEPQKNQEPVVEPMNTEEDDPSSTKAEAANSLIPSFIELSDEQGEAGPKFSSSEQASSLAKLERAEKDDKTLEKLCGSLRPGEFFRIFSQLNLLRLTNKASRFL
jgi:hypothetical protein